MLRIGIVTGEYPPHKGGVGDFTRELALALAELGHDVHVITHKQARSDPSLKLHPVNGAWNFWSLLQVRQIARSIPLDIVNIQYQAAAYNLGSVSEQQGDLETAVAWFEIAATLDARDPRALAHIANIRLLQGRAEDALAAADAALERYPASKSAQAIRTEALRVLGRP